MSLDEDDDAHGYEMSPHVAALIENAKDDDATVQAFIADIFAQRLKTHHALAMDGPRFEECLDSFIARAPRIIEVIVIKNGAEGFSIQQIQRITDDLVRLEDREFVRRYGLEELFAALTDAEAAGELDPETPYQALAKHIDPVKPPAGAFTIDRLILAEKRARSRANNQERAATFAGPFFIAMGLAGLGLPPLFRAIDPATPFPLPTLHPLASLALLLLGGVFVWLSFRWLDRDICLPLPAHVAEWLTANGHHYGVRYWDELYWPTAKGLACRHTILGLTFWKEAPPPASEWPDLRDAEWDYWEHGAGRAISERYYRPFMDVIDQWDDVTRKVLLTCCAVLFIGVLVDTGWAIFLDEHHGLLASPTGKIAILAITMASGFSLGYGLLPPLRWLPRPFRRRWFGALPADAEAYRDFLLART